MGMWLAILVLVLGAVGAGIFYMINAIGKFSLVKSASKGKAWLRRLISFGIIAVGFVLFGLIFSAVNAIIIFLHLIIFWMIYGLILRIIKRISGRSPKINLQGWLAIASCAVYLSVGYYLCVNVWVTHYDLKTDKPVGSIHAVMFADSHIGSTFDGEGFEKLMERVNKEKPDIVLLAGDFVDDGTTKDDMVKSCEALGKVDAKYGVWYCYGNHDKGYYGSSRGFSAQELLDNLTENGVHVLEDEYEIIDDRFCIVGRADKSFEDRKPIGKLLEGVDDDKYIIVMDHQPGDYDAESKSAADLVVSGHTHGGQLFPMTHFGLFMSVNDRTYGYERRNGTDFLVTSGISDWELKFKTGTKSEYVVIDIEQE